MLNNLTNFFNLITNKLIKKTTDPTDLIALGTKNPRFNGGYRPTAITVKDFVAQLDGGSQTVSVDGITITGNGTPGNPLVSIGGLKYAKVFFVDTLHGNNLTGQGGEASKPFLTIAAAIAYAAGSNPTSSNKYLVYVRAGTFYSIGDLYLQNYIDIYCEPSVLFFGTTSIRDTNPGVIANFYGYAGFEGSQLNVLFINYRSTVTFEFTYIIATGRAFGLTPGIGAANVTIKGDTIYCTTLGTAHGITIRGEVNLFMTISKSIEAVHSVIDIRSNHSGTIVINCPKIYLGVGNIYGANFKQAVVIVSGLSTSDITINGDLENKDIVSYVGGAQGLLSIYGNYSGNFRLNGNILAGPQLAVHGRNNSSGYCTVNGDTTTTFDYGIWTYGTGGLFRFINGTHGIIQQSIANVSVSEQATTFFYNCNFIHPDRNKNNIIINSLTSYTYLTNCTGVIKPTGTGYAVSTTVGGGNIGIHSSRFTFGLDPALVDMYTPTGLIVDINVIAVNFLT